MMRDAGGGQAPEELTQANIPNSKWKLKPHVLQIVEFKKQS